VTDFVKRPTSFTDLFDLLVGSTNAAADGQPLVASACELDGDQISEEARQWVVMHDITDSDIRLIHWKPLGSERLAVRVALPSGEIIQAVVARVDTQQHGPVYGTLARFFASAGEHLWFEER
jgi:hypothetical protein